jgi:quinol monooxygenase YgiN
MYGTVARIKTKPGALDALKEMESRRPPGFVRTLVFQMDEDPTELILVVVFENKEAYFSNADSPEQNEEFMQLRAFLTGDPEWNDGEVIFEA